MHVCASSCLTVLKLCRSGSIVTHIALYSFWTIMSKETLEAGLGLLRMNSTPSQGSIDDQIKAPPLYAGKLQGIMWTHEWGQDGPHQKATSCCGTSSSGGHLPSIPGFYCTFNRCRSRWCECRLNLMQCMPHMIYIYIFFLTHHAIYSWCFDRQGICCYWLRRACPGPAYFVNCGILSIYIYICMHVDTTGCAIMWRYMDVVLALGKVHA